MRAGPWVHGILILVRRCGLQRWLDPSAVGRATAAVCDFSRGKRSAAITLNGENLLRYGHRPREE